MHLNNNMERHCMNEINISINIDHIRDNYLTFRKITKQNNLCIPVIKGNAYGFNQIDVVYNFLNMRENPQRDFFVYSIEEACELRRIFGNELNNIYCLTGPTEEQKELFLNYNIVPVINSIEQLERWCNFAISVNKKLGFIIQINLGLNRSGFQQNQLCYIKNFIEANKNNVQMLMLLSHIGCQYRLNSELGKKYTVKEFELFDDATRYFPDVKRSLLGSFGIIIMPEGLFESSRPGTFLFTGVLNSQGGYDFKTAITIILPVHIGEKNDEIYINFGIKHGITTFYSKNGFIYVNGEKIFAKKVERTRTIFVVKNNKKYIKSNCLLIGNNGDDYIDGNLFSAMNESTPGEILSRLIAGSILYPSDYKQKIIGGYPFKNIVREYGYGIKPRNTVLFNVDGTINRLTSTITEIRTVTDDGWCGYNATELVKPNETIATFSFGYIDGFYRKLSNNNFSIFVKTKSNRLIECKLCGLASMDQMCFKIENKYKDKIFVGDEVVIIDTNKNILSERFTKKLGLTEEEIFYLVRTSFRVKKLN